MVWKLLSVMPNIQLLSRFDAGQLCFIPPNDPQLIGIAKHCESTSRLLNHFKTPFNESIRPSALIADESVLPIKEPAVLALRNILALCAHWDAARGIISRDQFLGPYWTDYFDLYPYMPGKKQGVLHTHTPGLHSIDDTDCFDGQTNPLLSAREIVSAVDTDMFFC